MKKEKTGIVVFAFGAPSFISSNRKLAIIASKYAHQLRAPIYTQFDINVKIDKKYKVNVSFVEEEENMNILSYPSTLKIARSAVKWAKKKDLTSVLIIAAKPHLWRCIRDIRRIIIEEQARLKIRVCTANYSWFCPQSAQMWTRSKINWYIREWILRIMPFSVYRKITG